MKEKIYGQSTCHGQGRKNIYGQSICHGQGRNKKVSLKKKKFKIKVGILTVMKK
jgi:hypothetical protein